jgi:hypothetical protein
MTQRWYGGQRVWLTQGVLERKIQTDQEAQTMDHDIENWFTYHAPKGDQPERYVRIREAGKALALAIRGNAPVGPDQTAAIRKVREAVMTANQAIACEE